MKVLFLTVILLSFIGCNPSSEEQKGELSFFRVQKADMNHLINSKPMPKYPDLTRDKTILNRDYPIEIALYEDGKWYYDLPNLDTGTGTWEYEGGMLKLFAERSLFNMNIDVIATEKGATKVAVKFADRFGPKTLVVEKMNQDQRASNQ